MWKLKIFSVAQILREINFGECESSKNAIFAIIGGGFEFCILAIFSLQKMQIFTEDQNSVRLNVSKICKLAVLPSEIFSQN